MENSIQYCKIAIFADSKPPYFIGSQIRGALGYALKNVVCVNESKNCLDCDFQQNCLYYDFYERKNTYHHFRLDFELGKDYYDFSLLLFHKDIENAIIIAVALHKAFSEIRMNGVRFKRYFLFINNQLCHIDDISTIALKRHFVMEHFCPCVKISLVTPLRIKKNNVFVRDDRLELQDIFYSIYQRKLAILGQNRVKMPQFAGEITHKHLRFMELYRKSINHNKMRIGGIVGEIYVKNLDESSFAMLKLGELLGVGKQCSFGLGKIRIS